MPAWLMDTCLRLAARGCGLLVIDPAGLAHRTGTANLFAAGSSVFPTGGAAHPTFTLVALSLRLAEHLCRLARTAER